MTPQTHISGDDQNNAMIPTPPPPTASFSHGTLLTVLAAQAAGLPDAPAESLPARNGAAAAEADSQPVNFTALSPSEWGQLNYCEDLIRKGLSTWFEVGHALITIRENRLYRASHSTFESYCVEKWQMGRSYASRIMGAAERLEFLRSEPGLPAPRNEFQIRPFLKLPPEQFPQAWRRTVELSQGGRITSKIGQKIVDELSCRQPVARGPRRDKERPAALPLGQVLLLLHVAKKKIEAGTANDALEYLERIEAILFQPESPDSPGANNITDLAAALSGPVKAP